MQGVCPEGRSRLELTRTLSATLQNKGRRVSAVSNFFQEAVDKIYRIECFCMRLCCLWLSWIVYNYFTHHSVQSQSMWPSRCSHKHLTPAYTGSRMSSRPTHTRERNVDCRPAGTGTGTGAYRWQLDTWRTGGNSWCFCTDLLIIWNASVIRWRRAFRRFPQRINKNPWTHTNNLM